MQLRTDEQYRQVTTGLHSRSIGSTVVLLHDSWDEPMALNPTLQLIWNCLAVGGSVEEISYDLSVVFDSDPTRIGVVSESFNALWDLGLIEAVHEPVRDS